MLYAQVGKWSHRKNITFLFPSLHPALAAEGLKHSASSTAQTYLRRNREPGGQEDAHKHYLYVYVDDSQTYFHGLNPTLGSSHSQGSI